MQAIANVSPVETGQSRLDQRVSALFKPFSRLMLILLPVLLICLLVSTAWGQSNAQTPLSQPSQAAVQSDARKAFEKIKSLAGSWEGSVGKVSMQVTIRVTASGSAIMHDAKMPSYDEITMIYLEGDRLLLTHYCEAGNRSLMEGKLLPDGKSVEFNSLDVAGGTQRGFVKRLVLTMTDADRHGTDVTYILPDGKPIQARGELKRTK